MYSPFDEFGIKGCRNIFISENAIAQNVSEPVQVQGIVAMSKLD